MPAMMRHPCRPAETPNVACGGEDDVVLTPLRAEECPDDLVALGFYSNGSKKNQDFPDFGSGFS